MAFCSNCGCRITDGARFCQNCGSPVTIDRDQANATRRQEYAGRVFKCPNCGESLKSFESNCPSCGHELRGTRVASAVKEFSLKLEAIESQREYKKPWWFFAGVASKQAISKIDEQKINLIRYFAIPNTKEDILEFMILATSNIDASIYGIMYDANESQKNMADAWNSKIKQVYAKARNTYRDDPEFVHINELYTSCVATIRKQKMKRVIKFSLFFGWLPLMWAILIFSMIISGPKDEAKELARLEAIVVDVKNDIDKGEYKSALRNADAIDYQLYSIDMERKWDIQREYWTDRVLEAASENGVILKYTPSKDVDKANDDPSYSSSVIETFESGYDEGYERSLRQGFDSADEHIEKIESVMYGSSSGNADDAVKGD